MSAYIVNDNHLDVVVSYFVHTVSQYQLWTLIDGDYNYLTRENAYKLAETLYKQNLRSVNYRYDESEPFEYEFRFIPSAMQAYSVEEIAGALDCLEYQSCETRDYYTTDAYRVICHMRKHLLRKLQNKLDDEQQVWEISKVKEAALHY